VKAPKSWRSTTLGIVGAVMEGTGSLMVNGTITWRDWARMALMVAAGLIVKDFNVTGK
jgi:hypothetical protein